MRYCLFILLLLIQLRGVCQHAAISATKMNVLYVGVENPISFAVENTECSELSLAVENGLVKRMGACEYNVVVTKPGMTTIYILKGQDTVYRTIYRVKNLPQVVIDGNGTGPNWFLLDSLRSHTGLTTLMEDHFDFDASFSIVSYSVTVMRERKLDGKKKTYCNECIKKIENERYETVFSGTNKGAKFNESLNAFIQHKLMPGDKVFIEDIKVLGPDKRIRFLNSIIFRVQ